MVPEAEDVDAALREKAVARCVLCALIGKSVAASIHFYRQLCGGAEEVEEVDAAGVLAAELELGEAPVPQQTPEPFLGVGGVLAELAGEAAGGVGAGAVFAVLGRLPPHPFLLPHWGRRCPKDG